MKKSQTINKNVRFGTVGRKITIAFLIIAVVNLILGLITNSVNNQTFKYIVFAAIVILPLIVGVFMSNHVTKPLKKMYLTIHQLSLRHLDARSGIRTNDDFGNMSRELDSLADDIQNNMLGVILKISDGDISMNVESKDKGDMMAPAIQKIISCMRSLSHDTERLISSAENGALNERAYADSYKGSWKFLIEGMNTLLDKISKPLGEVMEVTRSLAVNDYTKEIHTKFEGAFGELAENVGAVRENLLAMQGAVVRVAQGDTGKLEEFRKIGKESENDYMTPSIIKLMENIQNIIDETNRITSESSKGNVRTTRGDESKFEGGYRKIIEGVNNTLDTIVKPMDETNRVLNALAVNDFTITPDASVMIGDFDKLSKSVFQVQENIKKLQTLSIQVSAGDISGLQELEEKGKLSENDRLTPAFTKMMRAISNLIGETRALADAAIEGRLDYRSDTEKFEGEFATILKSFNSAYHNMAKPVNEISGVMEEISSGNLNVGITGNYNGAFGKLSDVINNTAKTVSGITGKISYVLSNIADGNLNLERVEDYQGDFGNISAALNNIIDSLNEFVSVISSTADQVASGAKQVSSGSQNLSEGATEQASSVEELTASLSEISSQTKNNAENANEANTLAKTTKDNAMLGNGHMKDMLTAMSDINESSSNISKIIKVIDDIAFQTNILALNAAVEAARAGQYGKGFAVVAEEVRTLASRSAKAAKDTTDLIEGAINKIHSGTNIANQTAEALSSIVNDVDKVTGLVSDIATASNEQATGISQIDKGVQVVSNVVQTNSATAEESAAASEQLSSQAEHMKELLLKFKLRENSEADIEAV